jgi:hypothetical protein
MKSRFIAGLIEKIAHFQIGNLLVPSNIFYIFRMGTHCVGAKVQFAEELWKINLKPL